MNLPVSIGEILEGKYRLERLIGEGGMGIVFAAQHLTLQQPVAIKILRASDEPTLGERFLREARAASQIGSQHVARVFDVGSLGDGTPYMVMELLQGCDLDQLVAQEGPLPVARAVAYVLQACEALSEAHSVGIVHRDLKPANLFLAQRPDGSEIIKLLDFGISKQLANATTSPSALTATNSILGSPQFMAPEQLVSSRDVDLRADIWSLGVVLHELLTGSPAFPAVTVAEMYTAILRDDPERVSVRRPEVPPELETVILRCLEKDVELRFTTIADLVAALAPFAPPEAQLSVQRVQRVIGAVAPTMPDPDSAEPIPGAPTCSPSGDGTLLTPAVPPPAPAAWPQTAAVPLPSEPLTTTQPSAGAMMTPTATPLPHTTGAPVVMQQSAPPMAPHPQPVLGSLGQTGLAAPRPPSRRWVWVLASIGAVGLIGMVVAVLLTRLGAAPRAGEEPHPAERDETAGEDLKIAESSRLSRSERKRARAALTLGERLLQKGHLERAEKRALKVLDGLDELGVTPGTVSALGARAQRLRAAVEIARFRKTVQLCRSTNLGSGLVGAKLGEVLQAVGVAQQKANQQIALVTHWGPPGLARCVYAEIADLHCEMAEMYLDMVDKRAAQARGLANDGLQRHLHSSAKTQIDAAQRQTGYAPRLFPNSKRCSEALRTVIKRTQQLRDRSERLKSR